ncbi:carbamoyltransferase N-terminal domain-containing protein [Streptomyces olivaceus]|uniref:carbamoyltransferase family protein n=1 Tax=Streptomyces olivaceus TaxID=47716 RepID=UPI000877FEB9|nr:carbamoyltransferase N-terminal domain-containing protein [Streptomyces olivaceus]AOW88287.1 carbamoyltransferase [Streptomyces olivaceus]MBZ6085399.1 carbamoyltransferase [Streptomyces olivaceus]MBZ6204954.1 carbamoyltransferase [Streptomyces olivaceus]
MLTLGISAYYHDAAACLLSDGRIVGAAQEERFTRQKYDAALPVNAVRYCLEEAGATIADVDRLAFYEVPRRKQSRQEWQAARRTTGPEVGVTAQDTEARLRDGLQWTREIDFVDHHRAHAASAYYMSGFDDAAVLVCDAVGEWDTTTFWHGRGPDLTRLGGVRFPDSLGLFYSCLTSYLGYRPNSDEYKVMGLASYGKPTYEASLRTLLRLDGGGFTMDTEVLDFISEPEGHRSNLAELFGVPARRPGQPVLPHHADIAASCQAVLESAVSALLDWLSRQRTTRNLCLAGGVALNCRANAVAFEGSPFTRMFVQPAAGDAGTALGAALCAEPSEIRATAATRAMRHAYLGPRFGSDAIAELLTRAGVAFRDFRGDDEGLVDAVAGALADGRTVGWFHGRMEFGPRALGARSILADPRREDMRDRVNSKIKWREEFRPFAPAVPEERAEEYFVMGRTSPFMVDLFTVRQPDVLGAVTHVDGTARVQTVNAAVAPRYHRLLERFGALTGVPVLLNTSFNLSDEPVVCTPVDALRTFLRSSLDLLCLENVLVDAASIPSGLREAAVEEHRFVAGAGLQQGAELYSFF